MSNGAVSDLHQLFEARASTNLRGRLPSLQSKCEVVFLSDVDAIRFCGDLVLARAGFGRSVNTNAGRPETDADSPITQQVTILVGSEIRQSHRVRGFDGFIARRKFCKNSRGFRIQLT
jgi:hypothetical protein